MQPFETIKAFEKIKVLSDARRLAILRILMAGPATLTQLGEVLGEHPAWVRHHVKQLELAGLVELVETRITSGVIEKFYRAHAHSLLLQELILPESAFVPSFVFSGSHDLAVELLARQLEEYLNILILPIGSLDGLVALRQGLCHLSGCHLLDDSGVYNLPFIQHFFPDRSMLVVTLAYREQGLMLFPGNPKQLRSLFDLERPGVVFINRQKGSGTRLWLDNEMQRLNLPTEKIRGYDREVRLHTECARLVQTGEADVAIGLRAAASQAGLEFIPFFQERYDIVIPQEQVEMLHVLIDTLQTRLFRQAINSLPGYDIKHTGEQIPL